MLIICLQPDLIDSGATVYHFNENTLDSEGGNAGKYYSRR